MAPSTFVNGSIGISGFFSNGCMWHMKFKAYEIFWFEASLDKSCMKISVGQRFRGEKILLNGGRGEGS